jgi:phospholipid/cholesterol/gamma-HCH transport system permease protein
MSAPADRARGEISFSRPEAANLTIRLSGRWLLQAARPSIAEVERELAKRPVRRVAFDTSGLERWDSAIVTFLQRAQELLGERSIEVDRAGLPAGVRRLLGLAEAVPEAKGARGTGVKRTWLARLGVGAAEIAAGGADFLDFIGELTIAAGKLVALRARFQMRELLALIQDCGAQALPIVTLISFLVGLILAFVGAVQLQQFGATIYVANLVVLGMAREMGAIMTAIIMAGRTGAAFAAQLGTMKVTEEIDALRTLGVPPIEFLVLPRVIALCLMMPLLCVYSDLLGILGGATVAVGMLRLSPALYWQQTVGAVTLTDFATGIGKSAVFGVLIAVSGCVRGLQCGDSASAVGDAATAAVVTSIVFIVVADGIFAVVFNILGI